MQDAIHIPKDLDAAQTLIQEQARTMLDMQKSREVLSNEIAELKLQIEKLIRQLYGRKTERVIDDPNQLTLNFGDDDKSSDAIADAVHEAEAIILEYTVRREIGKQKKTRSEQLPEHLPRYEVLAETPDALKQCPEHGERKLIGYARPKLWSSNDRSSGCESRNIRSMRV